MNGKVFLQHSLGGSRTPWGGATGMVNVVGVVKRNFTIWGWVHAVHIETVLKLTTDIP